MPEAPTSDSRLVIFRNAFISGALLLAPLVVTILAFRAIVDALGGTFRPLYEDYLPTSLQSIPFFWDLIATGVVVLLITGLGFLSNYVFGKYFLSIGERAIQRIPGIGGIYLSVKQIVATFGTHNRQVFSKVVLIEYPRRGMWTLAFLTNKAQGEAQAHIGPEIWTVFVPTTPNPTSGFLLMLPRQEVTELEMSVGDAMKMIISGGAVLPAVPPKASPGPKE